MTKEKPFNLSEKIDNGDLIISNKGEGILKEFIKMIADKCFVINGFSVNGRWEELRVKILYTLPNKTPVTVPTITIRKGNIFEIIKLIILSIFFILIKLPLLIS